MCTCYNCSDMGHLSCICLKPQKQRIQSADSAEGDIKSIIAKAVAAAMDARELTNKGTSQGLIKSQRGFSGQSMVKPMPHLTNRFLLLETSTVGSTKDMLTPQSPVAEPKTKKAVPQEFSSQPPDLTLVLICSTTLQRGMELPLQIHTIGSNTPMLISTLIDSGATG